MLIFHRILCPVDFDDNSLAALSLGAQLAERDQATLYLMHVIRIVEDAAPAIFERDERTTQAELQRIAESQLRGISHEVLLRYGNPAEQILAAEDELSAELIVMATHGRTGISHLFFGSVAERVVRESVCPVLTVRMGTPQAKQA
jgi:universal stress protein A